LIKQFKTQDLDLLRLPERIINSVQGPDQIFSWGWE